MTVAHLVFALLCTAYIFVGTRLEEKDLENTLPDYKQYKQEVPMFMPNIGKKGSQDIALESVLKQS
jgi:protein-S-isoprenylcysteine O-methyltransferase Ste14